MQKNKICEYMKYYVENDKTGLAVLLTAPWGTGKSYFIKNNLIKYIEEKTNYKCILISLYGITSFEDLKETIIVNLFIHSDSIKFQKLAKSSISICAKAISSYLLSKTGVNIDNLMESLSEYISFSNRLIIFDDLERTQIDLLDVMGILNQLVENEESKILIVANEEAIIKYEYLKDEDDKDLLFNCLGKNDKSTEVKKEFSDIGEKYLLIKEKTIGDTLKFECDYYNAISNIILNTENEILINRYKSEEKINKIYNLLHDKNGYNLRTFIYACQKISDILDVFEIIDLKYVDAIFESVILFSKKIKYGKYPNWEGSEYLSVELGSQKYPLFRFCYDFIIDYNLNKDSVESTFKAYDEYYHYNYQYHKDKNLEIIFNCYTQDEKTIKDALDKLKISLEQNDIPITCYGKLCYFLVFLGDLLKYDYSCHKCSMIKNVYQIGDKIDLHSAFLYTNVSYDAMLQEKLIRFEEELLNSSKDYNEFDYLVNYTPDELNIFCNKIFESSNIDKYIINGCFISNFDLEKLVQVLFNSNSQQIDVFRGELFRFYRNMYPDKYDKKDWDFIKNLSNLVTLKLKDDDLIIDRIAKLQLEYLRDNLKEFIKENGKYI